MTSDSSSAVLDLNDEDTEPPSVTDDGRDGLPLIMETGYDIAVKVDAPMKQLSTLETFVTYRVRCVCARWPTPPSVRRRYNHFKALHRRIAVTYTNIAAPPLPPLHTARQQLDRYSPSFVSLRTVALNSFLDRLAKHPIFTHSDDFRLFLTIADDEFDKVFKSENNALNLWGLSAAIYGTSNDNKPVPNGARVKDPEWTSHAEYLTSLQQKLTTLCTLTNKLHKGSVELSAEMMNMKRAIDAWSSQAGGATSRALSAASCGLAPPRPATVRHDTPHRATLPMLAMYTAAHVHKIRHRDVLHAAYVSGTNQTGEMHNKLEQCSEALRSELSDWLPKTRAEIKKILLELAESQVAFHSQMFYNWERALHLSNEANIDELFKTVSKTAVQNLSPSKCRSEMTPTETERDLDDLDNYSNDSEGTNERNERESELNEVMSEYNENERKSEQQSELNEVMSEYNENERKSEQSESEGKRELNEQNSENKKSETERKSESEWVQVNETNQANIEKDLSDILDEQREKDSTSLEQSSKSEVVSDPLKELSDVDLS